MPKVIFTRENQTIQAELGESVLSASRRAGIIIDSPCNGSGSCGKCKVKIGGETVLACQVAVGDTDVVVETIAHKDTSGLKILSSGTALEVDIQPPVIQDLGLGDDSAVYGAAVDIGTTTLVVSLVNLRTGEELASSSSLNPQARHAQDVLSRITFASSAEGLELMRSEVIQEINRLIRESASKSSVSLTDIHEAVFSGNSTMVYLAIGEPPAPLGKFPYTLTMRGGDTHPAARHGIEISPKGRIYVPPLISAYVGADITSGILVTELSKLKGTTLFIDIGTNGEMSLARDGVLTATSTAAGPAFEGMNISCGMRAAPGAVERVVLTDDGVDIQTIGGGQAVGICGSGLLDAVGEIARCHVIDASGRFVKSGHAWERLIGNEGGKPSFTLSQSPGNASGIYLSQKDIRQVQLAKSAVRAGIELMLSSLGLKPSEVDRVLIAGSFGYHLREASLLNIGLLPPEFAGKITFSGNTSKTGAIAFLLNGETRKDMEALAGKINVVELANSPDFQKVFVQSMRF